MYEEILKELNKYFDENGDMLLMEPAYTLAQYILDQVPGAVENVLETYRDLFHDHEYNGHYAIIGIAIVLVRLGRNRAQIREKALKILNRDIETECKDSIFSLEQTKELIELISNYKQYKYDFKLPKKVLPLINRINFPYDRGDTFLLKLDDPKIEDCPYYNKWVIFSVVKVELDGRTHWPVIIMYNWYSNEPVLDTSFETLCPLTLVPRGRRPFYVLSLEDKYDLFDGKTCIHSGKYTLSKEIEEMLEAWTFHASPNKDVNAEFVPSDFLKQYLKLIYSDAEKRNIQSCVNRKLVDYI